MKGNDFGVTAVLGAVLMLAVFATLSVVVVRELNTQIGALHDLSESEACYIRSLEPGNVSYYWNGAVCVETSCPVSSVVCGRQCGLQACVKLNATVNATVNG